MKIAFTSDIHADISKENCQIVDYLIEELENISAHVFILGGDISSRLEILGAGLRKFSRLNCHKLFVAGNHDIWIESTTKLKKGMDSAKKYYELIPRICQQHGFVYLGLKPFILDNVGFAGSIGWYDYSLRSPHYDTIISKEAYETKEFEGTIWTDRDFAYWLKGEWNERSGFLESYRKTDIEICREMERAISSQLAHLNDKKIERIIVVLHHLPFRELLEYRGDLRWDFFRAFMGSERMGEIIKDNDKVTHVLCGHSHTKKKVKIGDILAIVSPVGYSNEWDTPDLGKVAQNSISVFEV